MPKGVETLDVLIIGYSDTPVAQYERSSRAKGRESPEFGIFQRDHVRLERAPLSYMDLLTELHNQGPSAEPLTYNIAAMPSLVNPYLSSHLRRNGYDADFVAAYRLEKDRIATLLMTERPRLVAVTTTFYVQPEPVREIITFVRERSPESVVVVGGPLVVNLWATWQHSLPMPMNPFYSMGADVYILDAQGESTLLAMADALVHRRAWVEVPNLLYLDSEEQWITTRRAPEANGLNECYVRWSLFSASQLGKAVPVRTARSCAFRCAFCDYPVRAGSHEVASLATVASELDALSDLGVTDVVFIDDTFNVPLPRFRDLCRMMVDRRYEFRWWSYLRCSNVTDESTYDLMARSGCAGVFLGIESGNDDVLRMMNKSASSARYRSGIRHLRTSGIMTFASVIVGFPGETSQTVDSTIELLHDSAPTFFRAEPWWYNHRSPIHTSATDLSLRGKDYRWEHFSMDSARAEAETHRIFDNVAESLWMPMYNFDFWALPYLSALGFSSDDIVRFHQLSRELISVNYLTGPTAVASRQKAGSALHEWYARLVRPGGERRVWHDNGARMVAKRGTLTP
jgi:radical SAM PhpK family P-methyltransferase